MIIKTDSRDVPPSWSDCSGTYGYEEWRVWIDGQLIVDEFGTGGAFFDDEAHAISVARWLVENPVSWEIVN